MGHSLISCGEGIVAFDKSRELLKRRGFAVMLESSEATSLGRIHNLSTRPLLAHDCDIEGLWEQRKPLYEEVARAKINVQGRSTGSACGLCGKGACACGRLYARFRRRRREEKSRPTRLNAVKTSAFEERKATFGGGALEQPQGPKGRGRLQGKHSLVKEARCACAREWARRGREEAEWFWRALG